MLHSPAAALCLQATHEHSRAMASDALTQEEKQQAEEALNMKLEFILQQVMEFQGELSEAVAITADKDHGRPTRCCLQSLYDWCNQMPEFESHQAPSACTTSLRPPCACSSTGCRSVPA